jgi:hypothetical protein
MIALIRASAGLERHTDTEATRRLPGLKQRIDPTLPVKEASGPLAEGREHFP